MHITFFLLFEDFDFSLKDYLLRNESKNLASTEEIFSIAKSIIN